MTDKRGPGRPRSDNPRQSVSFRLPADLVLYLQTTGNQGATVERALLATKDYRRFLMKTDRSDLR